MPSQPTNEHRDSHSSAPVTQTAEEFWESRYQGSTQLWSGNPNELLVREVSSIEPGTALDIGCGEGGDSIWLASMGWRVTGVDISQTALTRAAELAEAAGVADRTTWQNHDFEHGVPDGTFDLVSAAYFHSPIQDAGTRAEILREAATRVAPGGILLIIGHAGFPSWATEHDSAVVFPTTTDVLESLELDLGEWHVLLEEVVDRATTAPDGLAGTRPDNVLKVQRSK
jgi:SAM-dependent methyltransferase